MLFRTQSNCEYTSAAMKTWLVCLCLCHIVTVVHSAMTSKPPETDPQKELEKSPFWFLGKRIPDINAKSPDNKERTSGEVVSSRVSPGLLILDNKTGQRELESRPSATSKLTQTTNHLSLTTIISEEIRPQNNSAGFQDLPQSTATLESTTLMAQIDNKSLGRSDYSVISDNTTNLSRSSTETNSSRAEINPRSNLNCTDKIFDVKTGDMICRMGGLDNATNVYKPLNENNETKYAVESLLSTFLKEKQPTNDENTSNNIKTALNVSDDNLENAPSMLSALFHVSNTSDIYSEVHLNSNASLPVQEKQQRGPSRSSDFNIQESDTKSLIETVSNTNEKSAVNETLKHEGWDITNQTREEQQSGSPSDPQVNHTEPIIPVASGSRDTALHNDTALTSTSGTVNVSHISRPHDSLLQQEQLIKTDNHKVRESTTNAGPDNAERESTEKAPFFHVVKDSQPLMVSESVDVEDTTADKKGENIAESSDEKTMMTSSLEEILKSTSSSKEEVKSPLAGTQVTPSLSDPAMVTSSSLQDVSHQDYQELGQFTVDYDVTGHRDEDVTKISVFKALDKTTKPVKVVAIHRGG